MDALMGLLLFLEDEFRGNPRVRVRPLAPAKTRRSPDLPQDYDPESADLHRLSGVRVLTGKREYFFPVEWFSERPRAKIESQVREVHEQLEREG